MDGLWKSDYRRVKVRKTLNEVTGKESTSRTDFSDQNWGKATREYLVSIEALKPKALTTILKMASDVYNKTDLGQPEAVAQGLGNEPNLSQRANLVDLSDDDNCKWHPSFRSSHSSYG